MSYSSCLYMLAIMPPQELSARIHEERILFAKEYKCVKALKPPVHITLVEPFTLFELEWEVFEKQVENLQHFSNRHKPFKIELNNYDFFDNKFHPVVFIDVVKNIHLKQLQADFIKESKNYSALKNQKFSTTPHITIGYKDVPPEIFPAIKTAYSQKEFKAGFICDAFYLWKHNGANWEIFKEFKLTGSEMQMGFF